MQDNDKLGERYRSLAKPRWLPNTLRPLARSDKKKINRLHFEHTEERRGRTY